MSRLSRAMKREQKRAAASAAPVTAPIEVRVPAVGPGAGGASIGGVPVDAAPGEEIQHAVLTHLQRIALAAGHPVHATVHDERIGYVVPLRVDADGSSRFTAEPVRTGPAGEPGVQGQPAGQGQPGVPGDGVRPSQAVRHPAAPPAPPVSAAPGEAPQRDKPTHVLRPLPGPAQGASPTYPLRALPEPVQDAVPGTVTPPLGEFGPPPLMDARPRPADVPRADAPQADVPYLGAPKADQAPPAVREPAPSPDPFPVSGPLPVPGPLPAPTLAPDPTPALAPDRDPDPKPTPPRGFDAVAEAVLGDAPPATTADASPFAEPMTRINEAVKAGRTEEAAELAQRTVAEASAVLGPEHPEVLRMRELAAYIAYLAGDPEYAFALSLDVSRTHHHTGDAEAAYGSIQSAATAWRAVRDPALGLDLGRDLLALWAELTAEGGPAAEDIEELESAHARMDRLAARAAKSAEPPRN